MRQTKSSITAIQSEIRRYQSLEKEAVFKIGQLLKEAKVEIPRSDWSAWLSELGYSDRTARRYIQIYERFNSIPEAEGVPISNLSELLSLPVDYNIKPLLSKVKNQTSRAVREKVKEIKRSATTKIANTANVERTYVDIVIDSLRNIIPELLTKLQKEDATISEIIAIGKEPREVQEKIYRLPSDAFNPDISKYATADVLVNLIKSVPSSELRDFTDWIVRGVPLKYSPLEAKKRYRLLARILHPDTGGDAKVFIRVKRFYDEYKTRVA